MKSGLDAKPLFLQVDMLSNEFIKVGLFHTFSIQTRILVEEAIIKYFLNSSANIFLPCAVLHCNWVIHSWCTISIASGCPRIILILALTYSDSIQKRQSTYLLTFLLMNNSENKLYFLPAFYLIKRLMKSCARRIFLFFCRSARLLGLL